MKNKNVHGNIAKAKLDVDNLNLQIVDDKNIIWIVDTLRIMSSPLINLAKEDETRRFSGNLQLTAADNTITEVPVYAIIAIPGRLTYPYRLSEDDYVGLKVTLVYDEPENE